MVILLQLINLDFNEISDLARIFSTVETGLYLVNWLIGYQLWLTGLINNQESILWPITEKNTHK